MSLLKTREDAVAAIYNDGLIVVAGGSLDDDYATDSVEVFHPENGVFRAIVPLKTPRIWPVGGLIGELLWVEDDLRGGKDGWSWTINSGQFFYICGGGARANGGTIIHKSCERYDFKAGSWDRVLGMPTAIRGAPAVADGKRNRLYIIGGESHAGALNSLLTHDPSRNKWTAMASLRRRRRYSAAAPFGAGTMVVCGGLDASWLTLGSCEQYLFDKDRWTTFAPLNQGRYNHGMANFKGRLYVLGGDSEGHVRRRYSLDTIEEYNATSGEWRVLDNCYLPKQMDDFATVVYYE